MSDNIIDDNIMKMEKIKTRKIPKKRNKINDKKIIQTPELKKCEELVTDQSNKKKKIQPLELKKCEESVKKESNKKKKIQTSELKKCEESVTKESNKINDEKKIQPPELECVQSIIDIKHYHYARFTLSPLRHGQANTIGSAIRRALLDEVEGTGITQAIFHNIGNENIVSEYSVLEGFTESITEIGINLKEIVLRSDAYGLQEASIHVVGPREVIAQDIMLPPSVKIIDPTQHIVTINSSMTLDISLGIEKGRGYHLKNEGIVVTDHDNFVSYNIDAAFAPVQNVNYSVHSYWNEKNEMQEILFLEIWTNGGLTPKEALYEASRNLIDFLLPFFNTEKSEDLSFDKRDPYDQLYIDQMDLVFSNKIRNFIKKANIITLSDLLKYSQEDLMKLKYLKKESIQEILDFIEKVRKMKL
uniref:DNA-directed RNA polymerase n=1 Tax=Callitris pyramidalis TaxID=214228 RepID=A0A8F8X9M8_9CONI|nr:RNA polymerase alpha subunit [Callitris pyramidalis]